MKKKKFAVLIMPTLAFLLSIQNINAQTCPKNKILVCGCENYFHYVCKCVNENNAARWLNDHICRGFLVVPAKEDLLAASLENAANQISSVNADSNFNWHISGSSAPSVFPNPSSGNATISFSLAQTEKISIKVFDATGRLIKSASGKEMKVVNDEIAWNKKDENEKNVPSGIYFVKLDGFNYSETRKITVIK